MTSGTRMLRTHRITVRFVALLSIAVLVGLSGVSVLSYAGYSSAVEEVYEHMCLSSLRQVANSFDIILQNIIDISRLLYEDDLQDGQSIPSTEILDLMKIDVFEEYAARVRLQSLIDRLQYSNRFIHSVYLYSSATGIVGTSNNGFFPIETFTDRRFLEWYRADSETIALINTHPVPEVTRTGALSHLFSICVRIPIGSDIDTSLGALVINLSQSRTYEEIVSGLYIDSKSELYVADDDGHVILARKSEELYLPVSGLWVGRLPERVVIRDEETYLVVRYSNPQRGWEYIAAYPYRGIRSSKLLFARAVILISLSVLAACLLGIGYLLIRQLKPLDELDHFVRNSMSAHQGKSSRAVPLAGLKDTVYTIFKDNISLRDRLSISWPVFRERYLRSIVTGDAVPRGNPAGQLEAFGIDIAPGDLTLALIGFDGNAADNSAQEANGRWRHENLIQLGVRTIIDAELAAAAYSSFTVDAGSDTVAVVVHTAGRGSGEFVTLLRSVQEKLKNDVGIAATVAMSDEVATLQTLENAYARAQHAMQYRLLYGEGSIIHYNDVKPEGRSSLEYPKEEESKLKVFLRIGSRAASLESLDKMLSSISRAGTFIEAKLDIMQLYSALVSVAEELKLGAEPYFTADRSIESLFANESLDAVRRVFREVVSMILDRIEKEADEKKSRYYRRIRTYIDEEYMRDISLEMASEEIGLSPTYINRILRSTENRSFIDALNNRRIATACSYLTETDRQIKDIALSVGFSSPNYFNRIFKDLIGVTPGRYRRNAHQTE
jgi:AraC-like DNA-binding protein